jgi:hypothetical protein
MNRREFIAAGLYAPLIGDALLERSPMPSSRETREVMWRRVNDNLSFERARIVIDASGAEISGTVLAAQNRFPLRVDYRIECDAAWQTRNVHVAQSLRGKLTAIRLEHDGHGRWRRDGVDDNTLMNCTDVDLGISPSTNALPVNRLKLALGARKEIDAAWVQFPDLRVTPARQSYRHLAERAYEYRSVASGFTALLVVDEGGLPIDYAGVWSRVAEGPAAPEAGGFLNALISHGPSAELGEAAEAFGWLVGGWSGQIRDFDLDGRVRTGTGEWWFSWVLEGRAMQDVLIVPPLEKRLKDRGMPTPPSAATNRYGTTVRRFDRTASKWSIVWVNPVSGAIDRLEGVREGDRVVLHGEEDGHPIRWTFNEIRQDSFRWRGESCRNDGTWGLEAEFRFNRIG